MERNGAMPYQPYQMAIQSIFFDFDGVLAESVSAKTEAFREMYLPYGRDVADAVEAYHIANGGVSRFEKFKYWERELLGKDCGQEELDALAQTFSDLVLQKVIDADEVEGASEFLKTHHTRMDFWIITGTPTTEIRQIVQKRNIAGYFKGIHGSPESKKYWSELLIAKHGLERKAILFLGDATTDYEAAKHSGLHFALRENNENQAVFSEYTGPRFHTFSELEAQLKELKLI